jgi:hypothetical protein
MSGTGRRCSPASSDLPILLLRARIEFDVNGADRIAQILCPSEQRTASQRQPADRAISEIGNPPRL